MKTLLPEGWPRPKGYANGISVGAGRMIFVAGIVGWNAAGAFESDDLVEQFRQVFANTLAILAADDAKPSDIVRMTWYVVDKQEYLSRLGEIGAAYRDVMGHHYPAMACVEVSALMEDRAKIEIETTCVVDMER